jgi:hypothetical protein
LEERKGILNLAEKGMPARHSIVFLETFWAFRLGCQEPTWKKSTTKDENILFSDQGIAILNRTRTKNRINQIVYTISC